MFQSWRFGLFLLDEDGFGQSAVVGVAAYHSIVGYLVGPGAVGVAAAGIVAACRIGLPIGGGHGVAPSGTGLGCLLLTDTL